MSHEAITETLLDMRALAIAASAMIERGELVDSGKIVTKETMRVLKILSERAWATVEQLDQQEGGAA